MKHSTRRNGNRGWLINIWPWFQDVLNYWLAIDPTSQDDKFWRTDSWEEFLGNFGITESYGLKYLSKISSIISSIICEKTFFERILEIFRNLAKAWRKRWICVSSAAWPIYLFRRSGKILETVLIHQAFWIECMTNFECQQDHIWYYSNIR